MEYRIETLTERHAVGIRMPIKMDEIGLRIGETLPQVFAAAGEHAAGAPVARWFDKEGGGCEMELSVPVDVPVDGPVDVPVDGPLGAQGRVVPTTLPGGRAVVAWHVGPYEGLSAAWRALDAWLAENGHERREAPWEEYVNDCSETPPEKVRTRLVCPID